MPDVPFQVRLSLARADFELNVDLALPARGITVLYGPSGSGKTSLLRCVAGLERAVSPAGRAPARVVVGREVWQDEAAGVFLPTHQRPLGYVFQEASLFEHLDVRGNLQYGLKRSWRGAFLAQGQRTLDEAVALLGIDHLLARRVQQLSGGERQRVAIARALATGPRLLLLDEPLAALDAARRQEILPWLERLRDELRLPMLYVTHSADELARLAQHLVVLDRGQVSTAGPVEEVLAALDSAVVVGEDAGALLHGTVVERNASWLLARVTFPGGELWLRDDAVELGHAVRLRVLARDVSLALVEPRQTSIQNLLPAVVDTIAPDAHASQVLVRLRCGDSLLLARVTRRACDSLGLRAGLPVWAQVKSAALVR
ncbi:molybdenum ABC transporter ATP-binding protein [Hylemonella gracilis str. Niagara R]|uniref:Molybdenum ABC transporter ATP-binding protein n=1 Tax=Hylemonella gracilis str. Niagara R TaxID=1458275 RepID=A0A016XL30_9BURK|nr:molybdenum ABC transporter ATP-binding protein [Hylemonella gracilis]EYC51923.1 molybdenum ABC transporter ATP-binding protein [Hylemonella gracilis str. Niagara R]